MPAQKPSSSVFISHSSKDNEFVRRLADELKKHGVKFWLDAHELDLGDSLFDTIAPAIDKADYFAVVLSSNSINSPWVKRELNAAMTREDEEGRKIILPLLLEDVPIPRFIKDKVFADFTSEGKFDESFKKILKVLGVREKEIPDQTSLDNLGGKLYPDFFLPDLRFFVGRESLLTTIRETLDTDHRAVIHDISGLGKTFTSYKFVYDNYKKYAKIFWVRTTKEEMLESLAKNGEAINPDLANLTEQAAKAKGFKDWLEENENWLVIYDNVDKPNELWPYVPVNLNGDCLFTSNYREATRLGTDIKITTLDKTDAGMLLFSRVENKPYSSPSFESTEEETAFNNIVREIDGLPLTLNATGAVIYEKNWTFAKFWKKYTESPDIAWDSEDKYSDYQHRSAGFVFSLAYDELRKDKKTGKAVRIILNAMSFLSPDEIPEELLREVLRTQDDSFAQIAKPDDFWDEVLEKLTAYDLLKYDRQKQIFTTHRAIQRVIQSRITKKAEDICKKLSRLLFNFFPKYDYSNRPACEKYYQHALTLTENAGNLKLVTSEINSLFYRLGHYQRLMGNFALAEKFCCRDVEISAGVSGVESARHATALNNLAIVYNSQGRYDEAIEKYEEALRIDEKTIGKEHPSYAVRLNNLAAVYRLQGRYDEAIENFEEALRIDEKTIGREHPEYAIHVNNLASVYDAQGKYDDAIDKYEEALRINEKTKDEQHPEYASSLNNIANAYMKQNKLDLAEPYYQRAREIREKALGKIHPSTALSYWCIGVLREKQEKNAEALPMFEEAYRQYVHFLGENHPDTKSLKVYMDNCRKTLNIKTK